MSQTPSDTFKLSYPFTTAAGTRIELVELKRLTVKDLKQVRKISKTRRLGRTADCPQYWSSPEDLDNMDLADYLQLQKRFQLITGMGESNQALTQAQGLLARWFRFQPGD